MNIMIQNDLKFSFSTNRVTAPKRGNKLKAMPERNKTTKRTDDEKQNNGR